MAELVFLFILYTLFVIYWWRKQLAHNRRLQAYRYRIHVNGTRGKSTVTRLIAGVLREAGYRTVAKTTGSAAVTIDFEGNDTPIQRRGPANVKEQLDVIANWESLKPEVMVMECMALQPKYQKWSQEKVLQAQIGVITNVREDHQEVMGETLSEIAASLAQMCPTNGFLITAESDPELRAVLRREAEKRGSRLIMADPGRVTDAKIARFKYLAFKENVAIGLAVANLLGIDRDVAMRGMLKARNDSGVPKLQWVVLRGKQILWANLFAVNDRESMIISMQRLENHSDAKTVKIGILNNRSDRVRRAKQFSDVAVKDLSFDWLITFGAFEDLVSQSLIANGYPPERIVNLGFSIKPTLDQILDTIADMIPSGYRAILVGFVNIHTPQAEMLVEHFESLKGVSTEPVGASVPMGAGYLAKPHFERSTGAPKPIK